MPTLPGVTVARPPMIRDVDRFMSECPSLTNFIDSAVATIALALWKARPDSARFSVALTDAVEESAGDASPPPSGRPSLLRGLFVQL